MFRIALAVVLATPVLAQASTFTITGADCPSPTTWAGSGFTPSGNIQIVSSTDVGADSLTVGGCVVTTGLAAPTARAVMAADASGNLAFNPNLPSAACGMFMQIVDLTTCTVSDIAQMPAQNWFKVGSYNVGDGASWVGAPATYTCKEACAEHFGAGDYACSTITNKLTATAKNTGYAIGGCGINDDDYKVGATYVPGSFSSWTQDNCTFDDTNYCYVR